MMDRRYLLGAGGLVLASTFRPLACLAGKQSHEPRVIEIAMRSDADGAKVWFDPIGVLAHPGDIIRWIIRENVHTVTAYHPANNNHSLRIPKAAKPWNSGFLVNPGDQFQVKLDVPGVYDYFCAPHEEAGMVGRIIVEEPSGPGAEPFDYFKRPELEKNWMDVPAQARIAFPLINQIMTQGIVRIGSRFVMTCGET